MQIQIYRFKLWGFTTTEFVCGERGRVACIEIRGLAGEGMMRRIVVYIGKFGSVCARSL